MVMVIRMTSVAARFRVAFELTLFLQPINFLSLLHPSSAPPYHLFVARIIKASDQQASIFLQQKLKVADVEERGKIIDALR
jgi:pumilio RNA-binding family